MAEEKPAFFSPFQESQYSIVPPRPKWNDYYAGFIAVLLSPLVLVSYLITGLYLLPAVALVGVYIKRNLRPPLRFIERNAGFSFMAALLFIYCIPVTVLSLVYVPVVVLVNAVLTLPLLPFRWAIFRENMALLKSLSFGVGSPPLFWGWFDIVSGTMGMLHKRGPGMLALQLPKTLFVNPITKYTLSINPILFTLEEKYCSQWTAPVNLPPDQIYSALLEYCTSVALEPCAGADAPAEIFQPHYQYPPADADRNRFMFGVQYVGVFGGGMNFTHTRFDWEGNTSRSETALRGLYQVPLSALNPFHPLTGYVEVNLNISGTQAEHPMWCLAGDHFFGTFFLHQTEILFFEWAPHLVDLLESSTRTSSDEPNTGFSD